MAQALESDPECRDDPRHGRPRARRCALERTEFVRADQTYSILSRIVRATQVDTIVHTFLVTDSTNGVRAGPARDQRHRDDEPARRGRLSPAPGAPGRGEVLDPRLRVRRHGPGLVLRGDAATEAARTASGALARRGGGARPRLRRGQPLDGGRRSCGSPTCSGTDIITPISTNLSGRLLPCIAGFDPLVQFVEEDDVVRALEHVTRRPDPRRLQRRRRRQAALERGRRHLRDTAVAASARSPPGSPPRPSCAPG